MKVIVITGSTRGIGYGMAEEFLKRDCAVIINGRSQQSVDNAVEKLSTSYSADCILGFACDVSNYEQLQAMWDAAIERFSKVDYWINNAGIDLDNDIFPDLSVEDYTRCVNINLLGMMHGSHIAVNGMIKQGHGQLFNMEGFGSGGRQRNGFTPYGSTKYALRYFTQSLQKEVADKPVLVCTLSPGMVVTEMLMGGYKTDEEIQRAQKIFNILADKVETVTPYLVDKMLANTKDGAAIAWLTTPKIIWRFMTASFNKRNLFED